MNKYQWLLASVGQFRGMKLNDAIDVIKDMADGCGFYVNVMDPVFNTRPIDNDDMRLNIGTKDGLIVSFTTG